MKLLFVGDVMLGRLVNQILKSQPPDYLWGDTLPLFAPADFRLCNLECVLADRGRHWRLTRKMFHFRSDAKNVTFGSNAPPAIDISAERMDRYSR